MNDSIVADPLKVDAAWLGPVLRASGVAGSARLVGLSASEVGTGQMARSVRFVLDWEGETNGAPASVVGKFPSEDPKSRATGATQGAYRKEVLFYRELAATLGIRTPRCHYAEIDAAGADFTLILEDISPASQGDQIAGCGVDAAALALEELAKLHAPRWGDATLLDHDFLGRPGEDTGTLLQMVYGSLLPGFAERYGDRLEPDLLGVAQRLGPKLKAWVLAQAEPLTVTHGDYRLDNMLFGSGPPAPPLAVVDWQTVGLGVGTGDAAYFLGAGLSAEDRRASERELIAEYHAHLVAGGVMGYDADRCWVDYRHFTFAGVIMAVVASMLVEQTERGDEMFLAMARRHATHALDLEAESLLS